LITIENVVITSLRALVLAVAGFTLLGLLGFNLAPIIASAGIAGLAISLGAQSLIKDFIGGFLIVIEDQFGVGDFVEIGDVRGTVDKITLRTVSLREYSGRLDIVPNGDIRVVSNYSRDWIRSTVDLYIPFDSDVGEVVEALEEAMLAAQQDEIAKQYLIEGPQVSGWNSSNEWGVQVRLTARVQVGQQVAVEGIFRQYALESLRRRGIPLAVPGKVM
jgi:small conductance mechanosensitive channel